MYHYNCVLCNKPPNILPVMLVFYFNRLSSSFPKKQILCQFLSVMYKCTISFRIFDFNFAIFVQTCHWLCFDHQSDDFFFSFSTRKMNHKVEFLGCSLYPQMPDFWSSRGVYPLEPYQGSALDVLGSLQHPRPPAA